MKTTGPVYNDKNGHCEGCSAAGLLRRGAKEGLHACPRNTQGGDTKTGPQTSHGTAERQPCGRAEQGKKSHYAPEDSV